MLFVRMRACHASNSDASAKMSDEFVLKYFLIAPFDVDNKRNGKRFLIPIYFAILTAHDYMVCSISSIAFGIVFLLSEQTSQPTS